MKFTTTIAIGAVIGLGIAGAVYGSFALNNHLTRNVRDVFRAKGIKIASSDEQGKEIGIDYGLLSNEEDFIEKEKDSGKIGEGYKNLSQKIKDRCEEILESQYSSLDNKTFNKAEEGCRKRRTSKEQIDSMKKDGEDKNVSEMINKLYEKLGDKNSVLRQYGTDSNSFGSKHVETFRIGYCAHMLQNINQKNEPTTKEYLDYCKR